MGIWMELGIFLVVLAFGVWQLWDVKKAKALLAKAGHANGFKVTIDMRTVQPVLEDLDRAVVGRPVERFDELLQHRKSSF